MIRADSRREYEVFFFNDTATTEIYTLSLHDALPIFQALDVLIGFVPEEVGGVYLLEDVRVIQEPPRMTRQGLVLFSRHMCTPPFSRPRRAAGLRTGERGLVGAPSPPHWAGLRAQGAGRAPWPARSSRRRTPRSQRARG